MATTTPVDVVVDVDLEELEHDPYPFYARLRRESPVAYLPAVGRVFVATWDLCHEAGRDFATYGPTTALFNRVYGDPNVMSIDGPAHRALRDAVKAPFMPGAITDHREAVLRPVAVRAIEAIRDRGRADLAADLCVPVSVRAIGDLIGFTDVDDATLNRWFHDYGAYMVDLTGSEDAARRGRAAKDEVRAYLATDRRHRAAPVGGTTTAIGSLFHHGRDPGDPRTIEEIIGTMGVIIVGGLQEPAHATANALLGSLRSAVARERLVADPSAWAEPAMEEGLRWLAPFGMTEKRTTADTSLGGIRIPGGTEIGLGLASANHDETRFENAAGFDLDRPRLGHTSFGFGTHFCIGNVVARALGAIVIEELFRRLPGLRLDPAAEPVVDGWHVRGAKRLPVVWG
jgi:cytochrome P450